MEESRMEKINTDTMNFGSYEYDASMFINSCLDELDNMDESTFETWLSFSWERKEIVLSGVKLKVPEREKKAILHFIAFWYYRNKEQ